MSNPVNAISPLDGRYHNKTELLRPYFSESALIKYRIQVEIEYLISLSKEKKIPVICFCEDVAASGGYLIACSGDEYKKVPMLSLTHGQPATPSTFGKEYAVFFKRLDRQILQLELHKFLGKFGGATGTWSAHETIYPKVNWLNFAKKFIRSMGLEPNLITTQIEPHDSIIESYHNILRINSI